MIIARTDEEIQSDADVAMDIFIDRLAEILITQIEEE